MKFSIFLASLLSFQITSFCQNPDQFFDWTKQISGNMTVPGNHDNGMDIIVDSNGKIYSTGIFNGICNFVPDAGGVILNSGAEADCYVLKQNPDGSLIWVRAILTGTDVKAGLSIAADNSSSIYTTGYFNGQVDADPGAAVLSVTTNGQEDVFISKLGTNGNLLWFKRIGSVGEDIGEEIVIDNNGNIYVTGHFQSTVDFDPGPGVQNLVSSGFSDMFILKLNSSGNFVWAKRIGGGLGDFATSIAVDELGNSYATGIFAGTLDFDPGVGVFNLSGLGGPTTANIFVLKLDPNGDFVWAKSVGGIGSEEVNSIEVTPNGSSYITGTFSYTVDFDPGPSVSNLTATNFGDVFILRLDSNGNFVWAKNASCSAYAEAQNLALGPNGIVYATGYFGGTIDFDPGPGTYMVTDNSVNSEMFIQALDSLGNFVWAKTMPSPSGLTISNSVYVDADANVYSTGAFTSTADFDPSLAAYPLTALGNGDAFVQKLRPCVSNLNVTITPTNIYSNNMNNVDFQWLNCSDSSEIIGAQNQFFVPLVNGYYAVEITEDGCVDTSNCILVDYIPCVADLTMTVTDTSMIANYTNGVTYQWLDCSDFSQIVGEQNQVFIPQVNGYYAVQITNNGCSDTSDCVLFDNIICVSDLTMTVNDTSLVSNNTNSVTYQWLDCSDFSPIIGAQSQHFTPSVNGYYAVEITEDGCVDTSDCVLFDNVICVSDLTLTVTGSSIAANNTNSVTYQWLDCIDFSPIAGAQSQSFGPLINGEYAVEITENGCVDTSECVTITNVGLNDTNWWQLTSLYPNPATHEITIPYEEIKKVELLNSMGELIEELHVSMNHTINVSELADGVYYIRLADEKGTYRFLKQ